MEIVKTPPYSPSDNELSLPPRPSTSFPHLVRQSALPLPSKTISTSPKESIIDNYTFWEGKVTFKKRKNPPEKTPTILSNSDFRKMILQTDTQKKRAKCVYCHHFWSDNKKSKKNIKWIECDKCSLQMHLKCLPLSHKQKNNIENDDEDLDELVS